MLQLTAKLTIIWDFFMPIRDNHYLSLIEHWNQNHELKYHMYSEGVFFHCEIKPVAIDAPPLRLIRSEELTGYKFHISLDMDRDNLYKGWAVVLPILAKYGLKHFKVAPEGFTEENKEQRGKEITVYVFKNPEIDKETLTKILKEITNELMNHNIKAGPFPSNPERKDRAIKGSQYISYRNDNWRIKVKTDPNNIFKDLDLSSHTHGFFSKRVMVDIGITTLVGLAALALGSCK
jgi:hypothetical protein